MAIMRTAARIAAVQALIGATLAEDRVFDSRIDEIDVAAIEQRRPFVIVTTDDQEGTVEGRDLIAADQTIDIVFETAIATRTEIVDAQDEDDVVIQIPDTDAGYELVLDIMCRRIIRTLQYGGGEWGDLFRSIAYAFTSVIQRRGADATKGQRFAARQIVITAKLIADPIEPPVEGDPLHRLLAKCDEVDDLASFAAAIRAEINDDPLEWATIQKMNGWTDEATELLGITVPEDPDDGIALDIEGDPPPAGAGSEALPPEPEPVDPPADEGAPL